MHTRRTFLHTLTGAGGGCSLALAARKGRQTTTPGAPGTPPPKGARVTSSLMLWTIKGSFEHQVAVAAEAGVQSLELVTEHLGWSEAEAKRYRTLAQSYGLGFDALLASKDWTRRPVSMVNPAHREGFLADVRSSIDWAHRLGCPQIILMSGNEQPGMTHQAQYASMLESAKLAADLADKGDVTMILENLNSKVNHKGYFLTSARESLQCVKSVDSPNLRMLFDIYHEAVQHGDPIPAVMEAEPYVAVFHVADQPGRHDPGTGDMKWDDIYKAIGKTNYAGYIALEFLPQGNEVDALKAALTQMRRDLNAASEKGSASTTPAS